MFTSRLAICKYKTMINKLIMHGWIVLGHTLIFTDLSQVSLKGIPLRFTTFSTALSVVRPAAILYPNIYSSQFNNHPQIHVKISFKKKYWYLDTIFVCWEIIPCPSLFTMYIHWLIFIRQLNHRFRNHHPRHPNEDPPSANQLGPENNSVPRLPNVTLWNYTHMLCL